MVRVESSRSLLVFHALPTLPVGWSVGVCPRRDMRLNWVLTVLSICLSALATAAGAEGKRKLQIGVKKRVDHCPIKSRKGDVLHMHYTVGEGGGALGCGWGFWGPERTWEPVSSANKVGDLGQVPSSLYASFHHSTLLFTIPQVDASKQLQYTVSCLRLCPLLGQWSPMLWGASLMRRAAGVAIKVDPPPHWPSHGPTGEAGRWDGV